MTTCRTGQQLGLRARCSGEHTSGPNGRTAGSMGSMQINTRMNIQKITWKHLIYNVGSEEVYSVKDIIKVLSKILTLHQRELVMML